MCCSAGWTSSNAAGSRARRPEADRGNHTGRHPETLGRGCDELDDELRDRPTDPVRRPGGGRPCVEKKTPSLTEDLARLVAPETAGNPCSDEKWVRSFGSVV